MRAKNAQIDKKTDTYDLILQRMNGKGICPVFLQFFEYQIACAVQLLVHTHLPIEFAL